MDIADIKNADEAAATAQKLGVKLQVMRVRAMTLQEISTLVQEKLDANQTQIQLLEMQLTEIARRAGEIDVLEQLAKKKAAQDGDDSEPPDETA